MRSSVRLYSADAVEGISQELSISFWASKRHFTRNEGIMIRKGGKEQVKIKKKKKVTSTKLESNLKKV